MARKPGSSPQAIRNRAAKTAAVMASPSASALAPPKKRTSLAQFAREVRSEARKITWTTRRETWITSVMVAIMVVVAMVFFWLVDAGVSLSINQILKLASGG
ncbi:preprotein translocase subunit SecE [Phenylobacterium sp.]|jgi:preprotein translocase subunit SecE|uniref:preprotein translocase subunit SecE n=1 Tax=Phenylobacterium sp. TaxID=1871053 RepID=UPI002E33C9FE|nr:preprotein translocase subunit SecE [Phenylobacterium sp.]HEX4710171.1 preprotein translocase subunit SecE [Phenylobacterium sp.]